MRSSVLVRAVQDLPVLRRGMTVNWLLTLAGAAASVFVPVVIQRSLDQGGLAAAGTDGTDIDMGFIVQSALIAAVLVVVSKALRWLAAVRIVRNTEDALAQLRTETFDHVHSLSTGQQRDEHSGVLIARVTSDVDAVAEFANWGLRTWMVEPIVLVVTIGTIAFYSLPLALIIVALTVVAFMVMRALLPRMNAAYGAMRAAVGERTQAFTEILSGSSTVRAYRAQQWATTYVDGAARHEFQSRLRANRFMAVLFIVGDLVALIAIPAVLTVGITQRERLGLTAGELIAVVTLTFGIQTPIGFLGETINNAQDASAALARIFAILDTPSDLVEPEPGVKLDPGPLAISASAVDFAYGDNPPVLHDVNVHIRAGERVAIVGETGSGKSTFAQLLCRLADPTHGSITANGTPLTEVSHRSRLASIRIVPQDGFLFDTTIRANIALGREGATDDDIARALDELELNDWVATLPDGLDTLVGERGTNLSAGERQLVSFVRAAVANPGLLILDEATSTVDPQHDSRLTRSLTTLAQHRTVISIAHRLSTAESADRIIVFDQGRVVEDGSHDELVRKDGPYQRLHQAWVASTAAL